MELPIVVGTRQCTIEYGGVADGVRVPPGSNTNLERCGGVVEALRSTISPPCSAAPKSPPPKDSKPQHSSTSQGTQGKQDDGPGDGGGEVTCRREEVHGGSPESEP